MSAVLTSPTPGDVRPLGWRARRRLQRQERRRLAEQDARSVRLAELHRIRALLEQAAALVEHGWIQHGWFAVLDAQGRTHRLTVPDFQLASERRVSGVCLVGGIVYAAGGPHAVHSQLVQRSLDLTWHALNESPRQPVRWCPSPAVRTAHVRDLTRWNDHPQRTVEQVSSLLQSAVHLADAQIEQRRAEQRALTPG